MTIHANVNVWDARTNVRNLDPKYTPTEMKNAHKYKSNNNEVWRNFIVLINSLNDEIKNRKDKAEILKDFNSLLKDPLKTEDGEISLLGIFEKDIRDSELLEFQKFKSVLLKYEQLQLVKNTPFDSLFRISESYEPHSAVLY